MAGRGGIPPRRGRSRIHNHHSASAAKATHKNIPTRPTQLQSRLDSIGGGAASEGRSPGAGTGVRSGLTGSPMPKLRSSSSHDPPTAEPSTANTRTAAAATTRATLRMSNLNAALLVASTCSENSRRPDPHESRRPEDDAEQMGVLPRLQGLVCRTPSTTAHLPGSSTTTRLPLVEVPTWHRGGVVLTGDACCAVSLLAGQGASLAVAGPSCWMSISPPRLRCRRRWRATSGPDGRWWRPSRGSAAMASNGSSRRR